MPFLQILILAAIQGITEFLPISSSGHLILVPNFIGLMDQGLMMDVAVHVGTLAAVIIYFWRDILGMITALFRIFQQMVNVLILLKIQCGKLKKIIKKFG